MAGITPNGFVSKTQPEIVSEIVEDIKSPDNLGENFPADPDSVFGNIVHIIAAAIKDSGWDLAESVNNQFNIHKAEGKYLDDLGGLKGIPRYKDLGSFGLLSFTGSLGSTVPKGTVVSDITKRYVITESDILYDRSACYETRISCDILEPNTTYTLSVEGISFSVATGNDKPTVEFIVNSFKNAIGIQTNFSAYTEEESKILLIKSNVLNNILTVIPSSNLKLVSISTLVRGVAEQSGALTFIANSINEFTTTPVGTTSVNNPVDFNKGRLAEGDEDYRLRLLSSDSTAGKATKPKIEESLKRVEGVDFVLVEENDTIEVDSKGRPPKSYECFVSGGSEDSIAEVVWDTKPAGILTTGKITKIIIDANGDEQYVKFSRPESEYAFIKVVYTVYDSNKFPPNGETLIKEAIVTYGESLEAGQDLLPSRFNSFVINSVEGLLDVNTSMVIKNSPEDIPDPSEYKTTPIVVSSSERIDFSTERVIVTV
jgi:uncharacterized phage protein gp47/JayE